MHREGTAGVSSREGVMEVAFEQWTERIRVDDADEQVGSNVFPRYREAVSDERCGCV